MKKKSNRAMRIGTGAAVTAAILAVAAGAYLLSETPGGKRTKAKVKKFAVQARKEVAKRAKTARALGEKEYKRIVDQVTKKYGSLEEVGADDLIAIARELKGEWNNIKKSAQTMAKRAQKPSPKKKTMHKKSRL
jgi:hypothetical protein